MSEEVDAQAAGRRTSRMRVTIGRKRGSWIGEALTALILASLLFVYIDFKIRKPDELVVNLPEGKLPLPEGVVDVDLELADDRVRVVRMSIDGPSESLTRLETRSLSYVLAPTREEIEQALSNADASGRGTIEHKPDLANVQGLPPHIRLRDQDGFPDPPLLRVVVTPFCSTSVQEVELIGELPHAETLELGEAPRKPPAAVPVRVVGLNRPPPEGAARLVVRLNETEKFLEAYTGTVPLTRFETSLVVGNRTYPADVLDPTAAITVELVEKRVVLREWLNVTVSNLPPGLQVGEDDVRIRALFSLPADRADELKEIIGDRVKDRPDPSQIPIRAVAHWILPSEEAFTFYLKTEKAWEGAQDLPVTVIGIPEGVRLLSFESKTIPIVKKGE